jgi:hypothetical protein
MNSVYTWIPTTVPRDAVGLTFQFRLDGSAPSEFLTMGVSNVPLFTMEAQYIENGEWQTSSMVEIPEYAGQEVQLFFSLNDTTMPTGTLSVRGIQFLIPARPELEITVTNDQPQIAWPVSAIGWQLESVESLSETNWTALTNAPAVQDYQRTVTDEEPTGQRFYRLRK